MGKDVYEKVMTLCKRRGFLYPSFEVYGGIAGFYDYGPLGSQLKRNVEDIWRSFYLMRDNCVEINTPTITLYEVLKASGHVDEFTDFVVDCRKCGKSYKVEDVAEKDVSVEEAVKEGKLRCPSCSSRLVNPHRVNLMFST
ncbi:MAG TPA: glycine--tRNA ligase, partial [Thermoplasmatales archaeon]|nr:glycine--tRNA ligase [Thermoplasmatales archaeon]